MSPFASSGIASWPQGQHTEHVETSQDLPPVHGIGLPLQETYSNDLPQALRESCACSVVWSAEDYRIVIILEAFLEQDLFA